MKQFIIKISCLFLLVAGLLTLSLFFIPDHFSENTLLASLPSKNELLKNTESPKIILIGGSNVSFGMNSRKISEKFKIPVINMGIHGGIGLQFLMNDVKPFIGKGDIVVLMPEYENFYSPDFYGEMELIPILFSIAPETRKTVEPNQWKHLFKFLPTYSAKKIKNIFFYSNKPVDPKTDVYGPSSFNEYGDAYIHWTMPDQQFTPEKIKSDEKINQEVISFIKDYKAYIANKGATLLLLPPVIEKQSFLNQKYIVDIVNTALTKNQIPYLSQPEKYVFSKDHFFNAMYHPNKKGVDLRTQLVIEDMSRIVPNY